MLKSAAVPSRISGSGENGANCFPSKPKPMVNYLFVVLLILAELGLQAVIIS